MHCVFDGYLEAWQADNLPNYDLLSEYIAGKFVIAERIDNKTITSAEAVAAYAALDVHLRNEMSQRAMAEAELDTMFMQSMMPRTTDCGPDRTSPGSYECAQQ
jgi:hypothetical protein